MLLFRSTEIICLILNPIRSFIAERTQRLNLRDAFIFITVMWKPFVRIIFIFLWRNKIIFWLRIWIIALICHISSTTAATVAAAETVHFNCFTLCHFQPKLRKFEDLLQMMSVVKAIAFLKCITWDSLRLTKWSPWWITKNIKILIGEQLLLLILLWICLYVLQSSSDSLILLFILIPVDPWFR